jgi:tetratricopeptide (TPR) repeat protein
MAENHRDEIARLEKLFGSNPEGRVFTHLAEAYRKAGELDRARGILESGLRRHDGYASAHVVLARVLTDLGDDEAARREFERVLELDPENRIALRCLGEQAVRRGESSSASEYLGRLLQLDPSDEELRDTIAGLAPAPTARVDSHVRGGVPGTPPVGREPLSEMPAAGTGLELHFDQTLPPATGAGTTDADSPFPGEWGAGFDLTIDWPADAQHGASLQPERDEQGGDLQLEPMPDFASAPEPAAETGAVNDGWPDLIHAPDLRMGGDLGSADRAREGNDSDAGESESTPGGDGADVLPPEVGSFGDPEFEEGGPSDPIDGGDLLPDAAETEIYTETLAELYRAQGFPERAAAVYRSLLADRPGDERLMMQLRDLEGRRVDHQPIDGSTEALEWTSIAGDPERPKDGGRDGGPEETASDDGGEASAERDSEAGDSLEQVGSAWTDGADPTPAPESPYTWVSDEAEPAAELAGAPIGAILGQLLAWRPAAAAGGGFAESVAGAAGASAAQIGGGWQADPEPAAGESSAVPEDENGLPAEPLDEAAAGAAGGVDAGELLVLEEEVADPASAGHAEPEPEVPAAGEPLPWGDDPVAESLDAAEAVAEAGGEADVPMPWESDTGIEALTAKDADRGAAPGDVLAAADEPLMPWEEEAPTGADASGGGEDVPMPWDEPRAGESAGPVAEPAAGTGTSDAERILGSDDEGDDDDDLDMFRSWLQSLKK